MTSQPFPEVPTGYPFPGLELAVLERWKRERVFIRTLEKTAEGPSFVFYEGPPTANNVPHVGHVVTRVAKDLFPRYRTMRGDHVARKAGWDTHGLAVEIEVEKRLGFTGKQQIEAYGIAAFNRACLDSVHTYERQWRAMTERVGYWLDLDHPYFTYANEYIESVWWALAQLWRQGLLVESYKIQPYCARCGTTLSSHEVAQNYKEAEDPSIWTLFKLGPGSRARDVEGEERDLSGAAMVGWTTTPWTTLANAGVAAHRDLLYRLIAHPARPGERLLFGDTLETAVPLVVERDGKRQPIDLRSEPALARFRGADLEGLLYERLFTFFSPEVPGRVVLGEYVTASEGTGLVHTAPPFGEDDYQTGKRYGLPMMMSVDNEGRIAPEAPPFAGLWFKEADSKITADLKARGLLLHADRYRHNYPFCWRCDRPLLYYATKSWFIQTTAKRDELVANNRKIGWRPEHMREGRFGNWLENVVDWALSRKRYWGTPLPIWRCDACAHTRVVGSYAELFSIAGRPAPENVYDRAQFDPHRPFIDEVSWPCPECRGKQGGTMRRAEEVIDAWFDSGAMPFAQHHYMGEPVLGSDGGVLFDPAAGIGFPADFISEAVDQTRGWFYTLHVLGTLLFHGPAYENCIVLGHVNDEQGRKMSKRLGNVVEPMAVIAETGADAMRWYFCVNDPEQPSRFSAKLVREAAQGFLLPLWNALSFFTIYANLDAWRPGRAPEAPFARRSDLDRWILLRLDSLIEDTRLALDDYRIARAARGLDAFLGDLTNWYIRRSRSRFWAGNPESQDKECAYQTLYHVLVTLARLLAPFMPFLAEVLHEHLVRSQSAEAAASVHLEAWPTERGWLGQLEATERDEAVRLVQAMALAQRVVGLGRTARSAHNLKTRQPLAAATLVFAPEAQGIAVRNDLDRVRALILDELNVKELRWAERVGDFVHREVRPNFPVLGKKLGKRMKAVQAALAARPSDELADALERDQRLMIEIEGEPIELLPSEVEVRLVEKAGLATAGDREILVALDTALTPQLIAEGRAREIVHHIQAARKDARLDYAERIRVRYRAEAELETAIAAHRAWIAGETLATELNATEGTSELQTAPVESLEFAFAIERVS